jgi:hypothetical protein
LVRGGRIVGVQRPEFRVARRREVPSVFALECLVSLEEVVEDGRGALRGEVPVVRRRAALVGVTLDDDRVDVRANAAVRQQAGAGASERVEERLRLVPNGVRAIPLKIASS